MPKPWIRGEVARVSDMNPDIRSEVRNGKVQASLRITLAADGDIALYIDHDGSPVGSDGIHEGARVEFCNSSGGGGKSLHTRAALMELMSAMEKDNKERPDGIPDFPIYLHRTE